MKPQQLIAETITPDGGRLALFVHDGNFAIRLNGHGLMDCKANASELLLGKLGTSGLETRTDAKVLIGGLGLGFTLRSVLESVPATAEVHVAEVLPEVVEWNRKHLLQVNGALLDDRRVTVRTKDVLELVSSAPRETYDAILLDIDNGPVAMVQGENARMYSAAGLRNLHAALRPGGRVVVWSAGEDAAFERRLNKAGFHVEVVRAKRHASAKRSAVLLYAGQKG